MGYLDGSNTCSNPYIASPIFNGQSPRPANLAFHQWVKIDKTLLSCILSTISPTVLATMDYFTHASEYVTITRPEISYAVNTARHAMHHPTESDFTIVKRIIRYLQGTKSAGLFLNQSPMTLHAYSNSDQAFDSTDR